MNDLTFKVMVDGNELEYKVLKILTPYNSKHQYVIYTDDNINHYASRYELVDGKIILKPILEEYEWDYIEKNGNLGV